MFDVPRADGEASLPPDVQRPQRWQSLTVCLLLALAVWTVFGQTLQFDFVNYDDNRYVYENPVVKNGLTLHGIGWAFTHDVVANWHPLTVISYMADASLYGAKPGGYHLTNVLLHALTAVLLFVVLNEMTGALWRSAFVAAVFAIHPLRVESVAWVSERKDVLSGLCFMLTLLCYVKAVKWQGTAAETGPTSTASRFTIHASRFTLHVSRFTCHLSPFYWLAFLFFALGLMSKPMLVTLPFVLLLLDYWPLRRSAECGVRSAESTGNAEGRMKNAEGGGFRSQLPDAAKRTGDGSGASKRTGDGSTLKPLLLEKVPFFGLSAAFCLVTFVAQQQSGAVAELTRYPLPDRVENVFVSYARYLGNTFWPAGLANFYPYPAHWPIEWVVLAVVFFAGLGAAALAWGRRFPYVAVGWFWFVGMLIPVIGLVQVGDQSLADRYTYLPQIGLGLLVAWGAAELLGRAALPRRRLLLGSAAAAVLAGLMTVAWIQTGYWRDSFSLWTHTLACTSENYIAQNGLGAALDAKGEPDEAIQHYDLALELHPRYIEAHNNLGNALAKLGKLPEAVQQYQQALQLDPGLAVTRMNLGNALAMQGKVAEAIPHFERALELQPDYAEAHNNLGHALAIQGNWADAIKHYQQALQLKPNFAQAHYYLGMAYASQGKVDQAIPQFQQALDLATAQGDPRLANAARAQLQSHPPALPPPPAP